MSKSKPLRLAILISGHGSNLQAIMDAIANDKLNAEIILVVSNREAAFGLQRAQLAGLPALILLAKDYPNKTAYDTVLAQKIAALKPDLIVLAGFMRILTAEFVHHFAGQIINIHPSLLPKYRGLHTHEQVLANHDTHHGCSIHFVTPELDAGPLIAQAKFTLTQDDTLATITAKVHQLEHALYPFVLQQFAEQHLSLTAEGVLYKQQLLPSSGLSLPCSS